MLKLLLTLFLLMLTMVSFTGCAVITGDYWQDSPDTETIIDTDFERMLGYVPGSWLADQDIWYGNQSDIKNIPGIEDVTSLAQVPDLPDDIKQQFVEALSDTGLTSLFFIRRPEFRSLAGFDILEVERALYGNIIPPQGYYILEGDFDEALIDQKLTEQGYTTKDYGRYSYYAIRGDLEIDLRHPLGQFVLSSMNRLAVLDDLIITSPVTADVTGIFDVMAGDTPSAIENDACRALTDSLGDVRMATITTTERIILSELSTEEDRPVMFDFTLPDDWNILRGYDMAALGVKDEDEKRIFVISLFYTDEYTARTDSDEIVKRMQSYQLNTWIKDMEKIMFTDFYQVSEPVLQQYPGGVVSSITCTHVNEEPWGLLKLIGSQGMPFRDLLFLAPDPSIYVGKNDNSLIIYEKNPR